MSTAAATGVPPPPPPPPPLSFAVGSTPHAKLSRNRTMLIAGGMTAVLVVVIAIIVAHLAGSLKSCGFYCERVQGQRLAGQKTFTNTKWAFTVDYAATITPTSGDPRGDTLTFTGEDAHGSAEGSLTFHAMAATSTQQAVQSVLHTDYPDKTYTNQQPVSGSDGLPGAQVGEINGSGGAWTATLLSPDGSSNQAVVIFVIAATHGNTTLVASASGPQATDGHPPFYLDTTPAFGFDYAISNVHFNS